MMYKVNFLGLVLLLAGCATSSTDKGDSLFQEVGGQKKIEEVVDKFIDEIAFNKTIYRYFKDSNIKRFKEKMVEHLCVQSGGPCEYTGDTMSQVHRGMNISEADFNLTVELLISAMEKSNLTYPQQNRLLKKLAPMRQEMLYQ